MDCRTARLLLDFARPRSTELEPSEADALEGHLAVCSECEALARAERRLDSRIGRAFRDVPIPDGLRERLSNRLSAERWRRRRRVLAWTARAAAVLLLVGGIAGAALYLWPRRLPPLSLDLLHQEAVLEMALTRQQVEERFQERYRRTIVAPLRFNYRLLRHYGLEKHQDKELPVLVFAQGDERARVYIITDRDFDLEALLHTEPFDSGGQTVEVWPHPENPHIAYVVICSSGSLWRFLSHEARQPA
jgi:hypothetical protein